MNYIDREGSASVSNAMHETVPTKLPHVLNIPLWLNFLKFCGGNGPIVNLKLIKTNKQGSFGLQRTAANFYIVTSYKLCSSFWHCVCMHLMVIQYIGG